MALKERRNQLRHPINKRPELLATDPDQLWSGDITKLRRPIKALDYHLYVVLDDFFSRYVVGWLLASTSRTSSLNSCSVRPMLGLTKVTFTRTSLRNSR